MDRVLVIAYPGAQSLDITGPSEVFAMAGGYEVIVTSRQRRVLTSSGLSLAARPLSELSLRRRDTVLVSGGDDAGVRAALRDSALHAFVRRAARACRRVGSVCSGAFVLAAAGILDQRRAATHWSACAQLARFRPAVTVDADSIFVRDGHIWTSAGVTTGIDMALAMVDDDRGVEVANAVAARLVLYARRPGFQSQWSDALVAQQPAPDELATAVAWLRDHPRDATDVAVLARRAAMSVRTFHRRCLDRLGVTPRALIEKTRVEHARLLLSTTPLPAKTIAARCGFRDATALARAFRRTLGVVPRTYRELNRAA